jgi:hypothetical protein
MNRDLKNRFFSSVTYPAIWGCASLKKMTHLQLETTPSPEGDAAFPAGDAVATTRPNAFKARLLL